VTEKTLVLNTPESPRDGRRLPGTTPWIRRLNSQCLSLRPYLGFTSGSSIINWNSGINVWTETMVKGCHLHVLMILRPYLDYKTFVKETQDQNKRAQCLLTQREYLWYPNNHQCGDQLCVIQLYRPKQYGKCWIPKRNGVKRNPLNENITIEMTLIFFAFDSCTVRMVYPQLESSGTWYLLQHG
jgi:hypothetical protein